MTEGLDEVNVSVVTSENVTANGSIITVKKGTPVEFSIAGEPDYVTFFSGEIGHQYIYRQRVETLVSDIVSSKLKFNMYKEGSYYITEAKYNNTMNVYYAYSDPDNGVEGFPGLSKTDFKSDSTLVADFAWKEMFPRTAFDNLAGNVVEASQRPFEMDVKNYIGKNLVIAIAYNGDEKENPKNTGGEQVNQPKYYFDSMIIENALRNDTVTQQYAGEFMFTALNFNHENLYNQSIENKETGYKGNDWTGVSNYLPADLAYGTVTANVPGLWNMNNVGNGSFFIHGTAKEDEWKTAWLVSDPINITACEPDQGVSVKNLSQDINSYTYTYEKVGIYKATFLIHNTNYKHEDGGIYEVTVNVVE